MISFKAPTPEPLSVDFDARGATGRFQIPGKRLHPAFIVAGVVFCVLAAIAMAILGPLALFAILPVALVVTFGVRPRGSWLFDEPLPKLIPGLVDLPPWLDTITFTARNGKLTLEGGHQREEVALGDGLTTQVSDGILTVGDHFGQIVCIVGTPADQVHLEQLESTLRTLSQRDAGSSTDVPKTLRPEAIRREQ